MEDAPLSDWEGANEDLEMVDAEVIEAEQPGGDGGSAPSRSPDPEEVPERIPDQLEDNPDEVTGEGDPQVPQDPQGDVPQPHRQVLQGFRTVAQTFSVATAMPVPTSSKSSGGPLGNLLMTTGLIFMVPPTLSVTGLNLSVQ